MTGHRLRRAVAAALLLTFATLAPVSPAAAHVELDHSEPAAGAVLDAPPAEVFLRFTDDVEEDTFTIRVAGPDGTSVTAGDTQSGGRAAAVGLTGLTENGVYRVRYQGTAADGHPVEGRFRFRLRAAADPTPAADVTDAATPADEPTPPPAAATPTAAPATTPAMDRGSVPWWPFALLLGIAAMVGVTLFRRR